MYSDVIPVSLGLPEFRVLDSQDEGQCYRIWAEQIFSDSLCPRCGQRTGAWSEERWRQVRDLSLLGRPVWLEIRQRRFRCQGCGRRFWEQFPSVSLRQRQTRRLQAHLVQSLRGTSVVQASQVNQIGYRIVERLYLKLVQQHYPPSRPLPRRFGVDEFAPRKGQRYNTVVVALGVGEVFDVAPGRKRASLEELLKSHPGASQVRAVAMDMWEPFYQAVRSVCRRATIVIDRFHVENHTVEALANVRRRLQRQKGGGAGKLLKDCREILLTDPQHLTKEQQAKREQILAENPELARSVELVKALNHWYETSPNRDKAQHRLYYWYQRVRQAGLPEFEEVLAMIQRWQAEILNYFSQWITNGRTEGFNTKIKLIIRLAYGFWNFQHLRARILLECTHGP